MLFTLWLKQNTTLDESKGSHDASVDGTPSATPVAPKGEQGDFVAPSSEKKVEVKKEVRSSLSYQDVVIYLLPWILLT